MRHYSKETKFKSGRVIRDTYVNPFKDCNDIKTLSHTLSLINQGKFCPTMDHDLPYGPHLKHSQKDLKQGNAPGWDGFDPGCLPQSVWNTLYQDAIQCYNDLRKNGQELPTLPDDSEDPLRGLKYLEGCCITGKKKRKTTGKKMPAESKLLAVLVQHKEELPTITAIAKKAGVSRKTAYACPAFRSLYDSLKTKQPKKGSKYRWDDNRKDLSTDDPDPAD